MPRLLLVDDNPSIHKIAESLLAHTQIEMVCADSGPKALGLVASSAPFDVALIDISMANMDGWELLDKLRATPDTARLPIAMMAGVLDTVDPDRLAKAPIQGFLKKPVELRDLADRIQVLLNTPVPEPQPEPEPATLSEAVSPFETLPAQNLSDLQARLDMDDVLELTEEDLYPETEALPSEPSAQEPLEEELDLEELDLESLKGLSGPEDLAPEGEVTAEAVTLPDFSFDADVITVEDLPDLVDEDARSTNEMPLADLKPIPEPESLEPEPHEFPEDSLQELLESSFPETLDAFTPEVHEEPVAVSPEEIPAAEPSLDEYLEAPELEFPVEPAASLPELPVTAALEEPPAAQPSRDELTEAPSLELPLVPSTAAHEAPAEAAPAEKPSEQAPENLTAQALATAIMANPDLMNALAKAVAAQLSENTLREVAWEIMPEIAERQKLL